MKKIIVFTICIVVCNVVFAQEKQVVSSTATKSATPTSGYKIGTTVINFGIGVGNGYTYYTNATSSPVISASLDHAVGRLGEGTVGIGGIISYQTASYTNTYYSVHVEDSWTTTYVAARGTWHPDFAATNTCDFYGAVQLGYVNFGYTETLTGTGYHPTTSTGSLSSGLVLGASLGGRVYLTKNIGLFAEVGYDIAYLKLGASLKF
jgi:hypothetical protein